MRAKLHLMDQCMASKLHRDAELPFPGVNEHDIHLLTNDILQSRSAHLLSHCT